jgi:hypothetical protein
MHKVSLSAAIATLALAAPALATPQTFYFTGCGSAPLTAVSPATTGWSKDKPTTSLESGGGCMTFLDGAPLSQQTMTVGGSYDGDVKQIDLDLFGVASNPAYRKVSLPVSIEVSLSVGGQEIYSTGGAGLPGSATPAGTAPGGFEGKFTIPDLDIPASDAPVPYVLTINAHYTDDWYVIGQGASDAPSSITFSSHDDIPDVPDDGTT